MLSSGRHCQLVLQGWVVWHACLALSSTVVLLLAPWSAWAEPANLDTLLLQAKQKDIWHSPAWLRLLHYDSINNPGKSRIDRGTFFLAPDGASNPVAEGEATLAGLLQAPDSQQPDTHTRCRFPARAAFLYQILGIEAWQPASTTCPALDHWLQSINGTGVALAFPVSYLNNPASLFGHTLLRIDTADFAPKHTLLSTGIGFSAVTGGANKGLGYAFNGIFGGYSGRFSARPYYQQVQEYGAIENRDIWEYPLTLDRQETELLLRHVWELQQADFDYFFFDENCSFQVMALLEAVLPDMHIINRGAAPWVIPLDTLRTVMDKRGDPWRITYRPSRRVRIEAAAKALDEPTIQLARRLAKGEVTNGNEDLDGYPAARLAAILDLAIEYRMYTLEAGQNQEPSDDPVLEQLLRERSQCHLVSPELEIKPPALRPDQGHASSRWHTGLGIGQDGPFLQWGFRPALHDRFDPLGGYEPGAELGFLTTELRVLPETGQLQLQSLDLVDIVSLARPSPFFPALSWSARVGLDRVVWGEDDDTLTGRARAGWGRRWGADSLYGYMLAGGSLLLSDQLSAGLDAGPWVEAGGQATLTDALVIGVLGRTARYLFDLQAPITELQVISAFSLDRANSLRLTASLNQIDTFTSTTLLLGWHRYFSL